MTSDKNLADSSALQLTADLAAQSFEDPGDALAAVLGVAQQITRFQTVLISEITTTTSTLRIHAVRNTDPALTVPAGLEIPLTASPCQHVAASVTPFTSMNMQDDAELSVLPAAKDMGASAYIGAPIVLADGSFFGTLVGLDTSPRGQEASEYMPWLQILAGLAAPQLQRQRTAQPV